MRLSSLTRVSGRFFLFMGCLVGAAAVPARAQFAAELHARTVQSRTTANFFFEWAGERPLAGLEVKVPADWEVHGLDAVRGGFESVATRLEMPEADATLLRLHLQDVSRDEIRFVLRLRSPAASPEQAIEVTPLLASAGAEFLPEPALRAVRRVRVQSPRRPGPNHAMVISEGGPAVPLRGTRLPDLGLASPFTVEFWMKTAALNCVVLSTWDGDEQTPYPLEAVVARQGRLMVYRGRPGQHQAMTTTRAVADGEWHHVAVVHEPNAGWTRLYLDGEPQDSLFAPSLPAIPTGEVAAIGGRSTDRAGATGGCPLAMDELRFWSRTLLPSHIRTGMRTPLAAQDGDHVFLSFENDVPAELLDRPVAIRRARTDLSFGHPVQDVRATAQGDVVSLTWETDDAATESFVVERSSDGLQFREAGVVRAEAHENDDSVTGTRRYRFAEARLGDGIVYYRLRQRLTDGTERVTASVKIGLGNGGSGSSAVLIGNYPNPFQSSTTITYQLRSQMHARVSVWDISGQPVAELVNETQEEGFYEVPFEAVDLPSGTYFVRLQTPTDIVWRTLTLTK